MTETNNHINTESFQAFFSRWLISQELHLQDLLHVIENGSNEQQCSDLINQIMTHYNQYFQAKKRAFQENVFLVLAPTWCSSLERAHLWIGGFRPGLSFRLVANNVLDLTEDQSQRINRLMIEIREEENQATYEFERVQEGMVSSIMVGLVRQLRNGEAESNMESAIERLRASMEVLVEYADYLRRKSAGVIVEILKPAQAVRFLAAAAQLQLNLRRWGMQTQGPATVVSS